MEDAPYGKCGGGGDYNDWGACGAGAGCQTRRRGGDSVWAFDSERRFASVRRSPPAIVREDDDDGRTVRECDETVRFAVCCSAGDR